MPATRKYVSGRPASGECLGAGSGSPHTNRPNTFDGELARMHSCYAVPEAGRLAHLQPGQRPVPPLCDHAHDQFRALATSKRFTCLFGRAAVLRDAYRFAYYPEMARHDVTHGLAFDL